MHGQEKRLLLRHYLEQRGSRRALARQLGISRDTLWFLAVLHGLAEGPELGRG